VLELDATQFVVIEAKMGSGFTPFTSKVSWFDQAAGNIAAVAWTIHTSDVPIDQLDSLGFYVLAPAQRLESEPSFVHFLGRQGALDKLRRRIGLYVDDADTYGRLGEFLEATALAVPERMVIQAVSWEDRLDGVSE
jgi:hypothetical protein